MLREKHTIDAKDKILGRLASEIAVLLRGKHKTNFTPHLDLGDEVIVVNTSKIKVSGNKTKNKKYYRHSGYPGGIKEISYQKLFENNPNKVLRKAIYGMLPDNKLRKKMMARLKLYETERS